MTSQLIRQVSKTKHQPPKSGSPESLSRSRYLFPGILALAIIATGIGPSYAAASQQGELLIGSIKTIDGTPVAAIRITFSTPWEPGAPRPSPSTVRTNSSGKFVIILPSGNYDVHVNEGRTSRSKNRCLSARFTYTISGPGQRLDVVTPKQELYRIKYVADGTRLVAPLVSTRLGKITYKTVTNEELGNPSFYCERLSIHSQPYAGFNWYAYEVAESGVTDGQFIYRSALGQTVTQKFASDSFSSSKITIPIQDVPTIRVVKNSVKFSNNTFTGEAVFSDLASLKELDLERSFRVVISWRAKHFSAPARKVYYIAEGNRLKFRVKVTNVYSSNPRVTVVGNGFLTASNFVSVRTKP